MFSAFANVQKQKEDCFVELRNLMQNRPDIEAEMQTLLKLQGKLTLHRLAWALSANDKGKTSFKLENKIDSLLKQIENNTDPNFIEAKKLYENNKLSRTGLARIMPYLREILNEQNKILNPDKREKFIIQTNDLKFLSILAEKEELLENGKFNDKLYKNQNSDLSILNFTKVINSSLRDRAVSQNTFDASDKQITKLESELNKIILSLPLSRPCLDIFGISCKPGEELLPSNDLLSLLENIQDFDRQKELRYDDFWLHVGKKYIKEEQIKSSPAPQKDDVIPPAEIELPTTEITDVEFLNHFAGKVLDRYPYFLNKQELLKDNELLLSLGHAVINKEKTFHYDGHEYHLPENINRANLEEDGKKLLNRLKGVHNSFLGFSATDPTGSQYKRVKSYKNLIPKFESIDSSTEKGKKKLKELEDQFYYMIIAANETDPKQKSFDFYGSIYDAKTGKKLARNKEALLSYKLSKSDKKPITASFNQLNADQKEELIKTVQENRSTYQHEGKLYNLTNTEIDAKKVLQETSPLSNQESEKLFKQFSTDEQTETDIINTLAQANIEKKKAVLISGNVISPITLKVTPIESQIEELDAYISGNNIETIPRVLETNIVSHWYTALNNGDESFSFGNKQYSTIDAKPLTTEIKRLPSGKHNYSQYKDVEEYLNGLDDKNLIIEYFKRFPNAETQCDYFTIVDKKRNKLSVFTKDGLLQFEKEILLGKTRSDKRTMFTGNYTVGDRKTNLTTAAGIFYSYEFRTKENNDYYEMYNNNLLALVTEKGAYKSATKESEDYETVLALHQTPVGMEYRNSLFNNNRFDDNRATNGCLNLTREDFEGYKKKFPNEGCPIYILPEEISKDGHAVNRMKVVDGKIKFTPVDRSTCVGKEYCHNDYYFSPQSDNDIKDIEIILTDSSQSQNTISKDFIKALEDEKKTIVQNLGLTNDEYNDLAQLSYAILGIESGFGQERRYNVKEGGMFEKAGRALSSNKTVATPGALLLQKLTGFFLLKKGQDLGQTIVSTKKSIDGNDSSNSRGLTQIKDVLNYTAKDYPEITEDNLTKPRNAAIATIYLLKQMNNSLKNISSKHNNITTENRAQFLYYLYNGSSGQVINGNATPELNKRAREIKEYLNQIQIFEG